MGTLDFVYILRAGSNWRNNELRYSLRSIEKNFQNPGKIFIIGYCPRWVDVKNVKFIQEEDPYGDKIRNAIYKIKKACQDGEISDNFILMNDDFYFLKSKKEIKLFNKGTLYQAKRDHETKGGYYYKAICNTYEKLVDMGIKYPIDFEMHYPIIFDKQKFLKLLNLIEGNNKTLLFRSMYYNMNQEKSLTRKDVKIYKEKDIKRFENCDVISSNDTVVNNPRFQKWMAKMFPEESKYEIKKRNMYYAEETISYGGVTYNPGDLIIAELPPRIIKANNLRKVNSRIN